MSAVRAAAFVAVAIVIAALAILALRWTEKQTLPRGKIIKTLCIPFYGLWGCANISHGYRSKSEIRDIVVCLFCTLLNLAACGLLLALILSSTW